MLAVLGVLVGVAIGIGVFALASAPSTKSLDGQVTSLRAQAASLQAQLGSLQAQLGTLRNEANASRARQRALRNEANASSARQRALRREVSSLQSALASEQHTSRTAIASLEKASAGAASIHSLNRVRGSVHRLQVCVPELQQEILGLKIQTTRGNGSLRSAALSNPTIISQDCATTLSGSSGR